jgi:hypothetical protein
VVDVSGKESKILLSTLDGMMDVSTMKLFRCLGDRSSIAILCMSRIASHSRSDRRLLTQAVGEKTQCVITKQSLVDQGRVPQLIGYVLGLSSITLGKSTFDDLGSVQGLPSVVVDKIQYRSRPTTGFTTSSRKLWRLVY